MKHALPTLPLPLALAKSILVASFAIALAPFARAEHVPAAGEAVTETEQAAAAAPTTEAPTAPATETPLTKGELSVYPPTTETNQAEGERSVYVIPVEGPIDRTQLFILRRALKEAIDNDVDTIVLNMDTPGGELGVTLEMMEALQRFPGKTITYVNSEAVSAGSFISMATEEIWFAPDGIMGAAEAVSGSGEDIPEGMQRKIRSYLHAKVRSLGSESRYRADVQRAMMDPSFKLEVDGTVLKEKDELLSLTAAEAAQTYGEPPEPLLSNGTAATIEALLDSTLGAGSYTIHRYQLTWSESFAKWFQTLVPLLLGIGIFLLFIEFKTPGFGIMGGLGIACLLLVFASNYFAGLAGYEVLLVLLIGISLLGVEVFILPGTLIAGGLGILLILGSLLWAMADIWPSGAEDFTFSADLFARPLLNLGIGLVIAVIGAVLLAKFLPRTRLGRTLILSTSVGGTDPLLAGGGYRSQRFDATDTLSSGSEVTAAHAAQGTGEPAATLLPDDALPPIGSRGTAVTPLRPSGQVEINGRRYEARLKLGQLERGEVIEVIGYRDFALLVK